MVGEGVGRAVAAGLGATTGGREVGLGVARGVAAGLGATEGGTLHSTRQDLVQCTAVPSLEPTVLRGQHMHERRDFQHVNCFARSQQVVSPKVIMQITTEVCRQGGVLGICYLHPLVFPPCLRPLHEDLKGYQAEGGSVLESNLRINERKEVYLTGGKVVGSGGLAFGASQTSDSVASWQTSSQVPFRIELPKSADTRFAPHSQMGMPSKGTHPSATTLEYTAFETVAHPGQIHSHV